MRRDYELEKAGKQLILLDIETREKTLSFIEPVLEVLKTFDGKVFNKRVQEKLGASLTNPDTGDYFFIRNEDMRFELEHSFHRRHVEIEGRHVTPCLDYDRLYLFSWYKDYRKDAPYPISPDKRINYAVIEDLITKEAERTKQTIEVLKEEYALADTILDRYYQLYQEAGEFKNDVSYSFRNYLDLHAFDRIYV